MRKIVLSLLLIFPALYLSAADQLFLNGLNETTYIYRTAPDSLNSYFRDAFSFSMSYRDFTLGVKFLAELPKYSNDQNQLLSELNSNRLSTKWTERYLEYEKDGIVLHGGTIAETFSSGMVFRSWEDVEFDQDTRLDGFLTSYKGIFKAKALYGALPNRNQPAKNDLVYGIDAEYPVMPGYDLGFSALGMRTLTALNNYNQQDVLAGRININQTGFDGGVEVATTKLYKNISADRDGNAVNAFANIYLKPDFVQSVTIGAGYKQYKDFRYRTQDLRTFNYHNEPLAENIVTGVDEEGLQGSVTVVIKDELSYYIDYAEAWNKSMSKKMNDLYTSLDWTIKDKHLLFEFSHIEKVDEDIARFQKNLIPAVTLSMPVSRYAYTVNAEYEYVETVLSTDKNWYYEPRLQMNLGMGKVSLSAAAESSWQNSGDIIKGVYWVNGEVKFSLFGHTDITLFAGKESGGKVCRSGICRFVAPFQGLKLEATTRF